MATIRVGKNKLSVQFGDWIGWSEGIYWISARVCDRGDHDMPGTQLYAYNNLFPSEHEAGMPYLGEPQGAQADC